MGALKNKLSNKFGIVRGFLIAFLFVAVSFFAMLLILSQLNLSIQIDKEATDQKIFENEDTSKKQEICIGEECNLPAHLFDITFRLDDKIIKSIYELEGIIIFESFGTEPTSVDLAFIILDANENEIYRAENKIIVTTEEVVRWKYESLSEFSEGKYTAVLQTLYNVDVFDEFRQEFEISSGRRNVLEIFGFDTIMTSISMIGFVIKKWNQSNK